MNLIPRSFFMDDLFDNFEKSRVCDMKCDIYDDGDNYVVEMDVPGYNRDDINIDIDRGYLTVNLVRENEESLNEKNYIKRERFYGTTRRQFYIGNVDEEKITAVFRDGVLKINVPRKDDVLTKKKIEIE